MTFQVKAISLSITPLQYPPHPVSRNVEIPAFPMVTTTLYTVALVAYVET